MKTYNVHFNDESDSNDKGMEVRKSEAINYIQAYNGTNHSYFKDYKGGTASVVCNQTSEVVHEETII